MSILRILDDLLCSKFNSFVRKLDEIKMGIDSMSDNVMAQLQALKAQSAQLLVEAGQARDRDAIEHAGREEIQRKLDEALAAAQASPDNTAAIEALIADVKATLTDVSTQVAGLDAAANTGNVPAQAPTTVPEPVPTANTPAPVTDEPVPVVDAPTVEDPAPTAPTTTPTAPTEEEIPEAG